MRFVGLFALPALLLAQITAPPEFQPPGAFHTNSAAAPLDGSSHVAAERTQINQTLVHLLRAIPQSAPGLKLIDNRLLPEAELYFRNSGPPEGLAVVLFLSGQPAASAEILCQVNRNRALPLLGEIIGAAPAWAARILAQIEKLAPSYPNQADAEFYWARALLQQSPERSAEAVPHLRRAASLDPKSTRPLLELGRLFSARQQNTEAVAAFEQALSRDPSLAMAHYRLASLYRSLGNPAKSQFHLAEYQRAKASPPAAKPNPL
jgi:tetratricopeptide (TPR) repeat protein